MAEQIVSPGVFTRENDQSFITQQPVEVGAAIVGPAVKGPVEIPTLVTSYSEYVNKFGSTFVSGGRVYSYLTGNSAYNYFQNGGNTLLVTRVTTGSFTPATASIENGQLPTGTLSTATDALLTSITDNPTDCDDATYTSVALTGGSGTSAAATVVVVWKYHFKYYNNNCRYWVCSHRYINDSRFSFRCSFINSNNYISCR